MRLRPASLRGVLGQGSYPWLRLVARAVPLVLLLWASACGLGHAPDIPSLEGGPKPPGNIGDGDTGFGDGDSDPGNGDGAGGAAPCTELDSLAERGGEGGALDEESAKTWNAECGGRLVR